MANEIISYMEMCQREGAQLQRGMNFQMGGNHSVVLMSVQDNSPYQDRIEDNGETLIYEGHDLDKRYSKVPKLDDQPRTYPSGTLTENGKFEKAALNAKAGGEPERVRVYEKIKKGIWSYNGVFHLVDAWQEDDEHRKVFKFKLIAVEGDEDFTQPVKKDLPHRRIIPTHVKLEVWKRDGGKCTQCGATDELHFDHILPYSKGGTSITADNVQLLCARHNLQKHDKIV
jgi:hypothetical protein